MKSPSLSGAAGKAGTTIGVKAVNPRVVARAKAQAAKPGAVLASAAAARQERERSAGEKSVDASAVKSGGEEDVVSPLEEDGDVTLSYDDEHLPEDQGHVLADPKSEEEIERYDSDFPEDVSEAPPLDDTITSQIELQHPVVVDLPEKVPNVEHLQDEHAVHGHIIHDEPTQHIEPVENDDETPNGNPETDHGSTHDDDLEKMVHMLEGGIRRSPSPLPAKLTDDVPVADIPDEF